MSPTLYIILITALPAIELRGAIPVGIALGMPPATAFILSTLVNILIIFPIFFLIDHLLVYFRRFKPVDKIIDRVQNKTEKYVQKYGPFGLLLFVAIPLPGSGAYSGCLAAYLFNVERKKSYPAIAGGVIIAGILVTLASVGVLAAFF